MIDSIDCFHCGASTFYLCSTEAALEYSNSYDVYECYSCDRLTRRDVVQNVKTTFEFIKKPNSFPNWYKNTKDK